MQVKTILKMIITDPNLQKDLKAGTANPVEVEKWLLNNVPVTKMAHELAAMLIDDQASQRIVITESQFFSHFRIQGYRFVDGKLVEETRGNYSKKKEM